MKQETLKEAIEKYGEEWNYVLSAEEAFEDGIKWQQENSNINALEFEIAALKSLIQDMDATIKSKYSEEEVLAMLSEVRKGSMVTSSTNNRTYWEFDIKSEKKQLNNLKRNKI